MELPIARGNPYLRGGRIEPSSEQTDTIISESFSPVSKSSIAERHKTEGWLSATPSTLLLGMLPHPQLRLRVPLELEVERADDTITVWNEKLQELGYGTYLTAAVEDFQQAVTELYLTLSSEQDRLGPAMAELWQQLQDYIEYRQ